MSDVRKSYPLLNGVILAGGHSSRMGHDKGIIKWFGKEHRYYLADILSRFCNEVYISCREDQVDQINCNHYHSISDVYPGAGPMGALLSAFITYPGFAWIVVACDLPLLNEDLIENLILQREPENIATAYQSPHDQLPEPLLAIWEPAAQSILLNSLKNNSKSLRKVLINNTVKLISPLNPETLLNANTPEDVIKVKRIISY